MTKQRKKQKTSPFGKMSFIERAGLLFGVVGLFADFTVLFTFATGISDLNRYIPSSISVSSAISFFALASGLIIIYGWFAVSWYLVRRTFVLLGQLPIRFKSSLESRSAQTTAGIGIILIPLFIAWSLVNVPASVVNSTALFSTSVVPTSTLTSSANSTSTQLYITQTVLSTPQAASSPTTPSQSPDWFSFFSFCFPFVLIVFGFIVWLPIILLMPIVHVELLLQGLSNLEVQHLMDYLENEAE